MKSCFIKGTNKQYSIREDGVVIRHYKRQSTKGVFSYKEKVLKPIRNSYTLCFNYKYIKCSKRKLLLEYFNINTCTNCSKVNDRGAQYCNQCVKDKRKEADKKHASTLSRNYIARNLNIKIGELTDELYNHQKNLIIFKRNVAEKHNVSIYTLK